MDQRLTSKRRLLALSALLLFAIVVLLTPRQASEQRSAGSAVQQFQEPSKLAQSQLVDGAEETQQLRPIGQLESALAIPTAEPPAGFTPKSSVAPSVPSATIDKLQQSSGVDPTLRVEVLERRQAGMKLESADKPVLKSAVFEEEVREHKSLGFFPVHRNAGFDSFIDASPNDAALRLVEWRRLLGVRMIPTLSDSLSPESASPDEPTSLDQLAAVDEDLDEQFEHTNEDLFSPLVIATVPNQEQYVRGTAIDSETVSVALAPLVQNDVGSNEIVDEEGYWEPVETNNSSLQVPASRANATSNSLGNAQLAGDAGPIVQNSQSEVKASGKPYDSLPAVVGADIQSGTNPDEWRMRSAIVESSSVSNGVVLPAATPLVPQDTQASTDKTSDQEKKKEDSQENTAEPEEQSTANDDKKMIGHLAGKFGTCFQSAISCGLYFGNEFTFLAAETPGTTRVRVIDTITSQIDEFSGEDAFGFGNRVTLGIQAQNIGFRFIYWTYTGGYSGHDAWKDLDTTPVFATTSKIGLETFDIDLTQNYCFLGCNLITACGVRFANYQGSEFTNVSSNLQNALETSASTRSFRSMQGLGPSFFMELRKTIPWCLGSPARMPYGMIDPGSNGCFGCCQSSCQTYGSCGGCGGCDACNLGSPCFPWRFYTNFRVSALWADTYSESMTESVVATGDGIVTQGVARARDKASLNIDDENSLVSTQIQVGIEHRAPIMCNRALCICRMGLEFQSWDTGKHDSKSQSYAFLTDPNDSFGGRVETLARADNRYLHLFGFTFLLGLNY